MLAPARTEPLPSLGNSPRLLGPYFCSLLFGLSVLGSVGAPAFGQSTVDTVASTTPETVTPSSSLPSPKAEDSPSSGPADVELIEPEPELPTRLVSALPLVDTIHNHFWLTVGAETGWFFGSLDDATPLSDLGETPLRTNIRLKYGLTSHLALGLAGDITFFSAPDGCSDCSLLSYGMGPLLGYHIVKGTRFDPFVALSFGYRATSAHGPDGNDYVYTGLDLASVTLGGNYAVSSHFGFGPTLTFNLSRSLAVPDGHEQASSFALLAGLELFIDSSGR